MFGINNRNYNLAMKSALVLYVGICLLVSMFINYKYILDKQPWWQFNWVVRDNMMVIIGIIVVCIIIVNITNEKLAILSILNWSTIILSFPIIIDTEKLFNLLVPFLAAVVGYFIFLNREKTLKQFWKITMMSLLWDLLLVIVFVIAIFIQVFIVGVPLPT